MLSAGDRAGLEVSLCESPGVARFSYYTTRSSSSTRLVDDASVSLSGCQSHDTQLRPSQTSIRWSIIPPLGWNHPTLKLSWNASRTL